MNFLVQLNTIYNQVALSWLRKIMKRPLFSMYGIESTGVNNAAGALNENLGTENEENSVKEISRKSLRFFAKNLEKNDRREFKTILMLIRVRIKGIITNLLEMTTLH